MYRCCEAACFCFTAPCCGCRCLARVGFGLCRIVGSKRADVESSPLEVRVVLRQNSSSNVVLSPARFLGHCSAALLGVRPAWMVGSICRGRERRHGNRDVRGLRVLLYACKPQNMHHPFVQVSTELGVEIFAPKLLYTKRFFARATPVDFCLDVLCGVFR